MSTIPRQGGRYTKTEKENRQDRVYNMHYEQGMSALQIAKRLNVNRNTINDDIKYLTSQIAASFSKMEIRHKFLDKIGTLEIQKEKMIKYRNSLDFESRIKLEKFISNIDFKIAGMFSKIYTSDVPEKYDISNEDFVNVIKQICYSPHIQNISDIGDQSIKKAIFLATAASTKYVNDFFTMMKDEGLTFYSKFVTANLFENEKFDLASFVVAKKILSQNEMCGILKNPK